METLKLLLGIDFDIENLLNPELTDYELSVVSSHREAFQRVQSYRKANVHLETQIEGLEEMVEEEHALRENIVHKYDGILENTKAKVRAMQEQHK